MVFERSAGKKIRKAISSLLSTNRFFGVLSLRLRIRPGRVDTISGDGITLTYNRDWVAEAPHDEIKGAIAHIVFGCALKHHVRRGDREINRWNKASRIVTAELLRRENIWVPDHVQGEDLPIEVIYNKLPEEPGDPESDPNSDPDNDNEGSGAARGEGQQGGPQDSPDQEGDPGQGGSNPSQQGGEDQSQPEPQPEPEPLPPGEIQDTPTEVKDEQDRAWDQASKQAIQVSKSTGSNPGNVEQEMKEQHVHRRDWRDILLEYMRSTAPTDYSWAAPNRRYIDQGIYLPSLRGEGMGPIVIAIDTSGSVDDDHVNQALTEMLSIARDVDPERVHLIQCDMFIQEVIDFDPSDPPTEFKIKGRGGTDLLPVFKYIEEKGINPEILIYMTDMEVWGWPKEPNYPVIWAVENDWQAKRAPFGQTIVIATQEKDQP